MTNEKEKDFPFVRILDVRGSKINLEMLFNRLIEKKKGMFESEKQAAFILGTIRRAVQCDLGQFDSELIRDIRKFLISEDSAVVHQLYSYPSGNKFMNIYFLDKLGVRLNLRATWAWRQIKNCTLPRYTRQRHNRMNAWQREKNVGLRESNQEWKYSLKTIFKRP